MCEHSSSASGSACSSAAGCESAEDLRATIQALEQELVACQRLAVLGNLAAMSAHEFRNLMTSLVPLCEEALRTEDRDFMRRSVERALTQSQRAMRVTEHLLAFARDEACPVESCSLAQAVQEAIDTATRPFEKDGIMLQVSVPDDLYVRAQSDLLCQVLLNLLVNAREAMKGVRAPLSIRAQPAGEFVEITVRDSGRGFTPEMLDDSINPFLAADAREQPTDWHKVGLGLSVCRMIAQRHGASLRATANDGAGCTFHVLWPKA